jgi:hypothetical protein
MTSPSAKNRSHPKHRGLEDVPSAAARPSVDEAFDPADALCRTRRLRGLLSEQGPGDPDIFARASANAFAEARALGPALTVEAVSIVLEGYSEGADSRPAERAVDIAMSFELEGAIPALVSLVMRVSEFDPVANFAVFALASMPGPAEKVTLAALRGCDSAEGSARLEEALRQLEHR